MYSHVHPPHLYPWYQKHGKGVVDTMDTLPMLRSDKGSGKRGNPCKPCASCLNSGGRMTKQGSLLDVTIVASQCPGKGGSMYCWWFSNPNYKFKI